MTEPSADDADLREWFWRCALNLQTAAIRSTPQIAHPCDADHFADDAMRRIDALIEQRVAAAVQEEREYCARVADNAAEDYQAMYVLEGFPEDLRRKGTAVRIATLIRRKPADRPAPEGAASTKDYAQQAREIVDRATRHYSTEMMSEDWERGHSEIDRAAAVQEIATALASALDLARPRCSTPSQEDTGSVSGEEAERAERVGRGLELNDCAVFLEGFTNKGPPGWRQAAACFVHAIRNGAHRCEPPIDVSGPGSASNTNAAQEKAPEVSESYRALVKEMQINPSIFNRPMTDQMTKIEDAPTQTIALPGPTAGDVERALPWETLEADELCEISDVERGERGDDFVCVTRSAISDALTAKGASARAELLAQIRELAQASLEAIRFAHEWIGGLPISPSFEDKRAAQEALERADSRVRALADKLTEAK